MAVCFRAWRPVKMAILQGCGQNAPLIAKEVQCRNGVSLQQANLFSYYTLGWLCCETLELGICFRHPRPVRVDTAWLISQQNAEATAGLRRLFYFGALDFKQIK